MYTIVPVPICDPSTAFTVHTPRGILVFGAPSRITHKATLHSKHSPACFSKCFHIPPTSQFQRLKNHMVRFSQRNKPLLWHKVSSLLWKISEGNKGRETYSGSGFQRAPSVMVGMVKGNTPCDSG